MRTQALLLALVLVGCECGAPSDEPPHREEATRGDEVATDHGPAGVLDDSVDVSGAREFELVELALADRAERARSWSGRGALLGSAETAARRSSGNWLCRLETHFGPPPEVSDTGFRYALRERATGYVLTAFADAGGPAIGGVLHDDQRPVDLEQMSALADRLASLMDATVPAPCTLSLEGGARLVGVEDGEWFERRGSAPAE